MTEGPPEHVEDAQGWTKPAYQQRSRQQRDPLLKAGEGSRTTVHIPVKRPGAQFGRRGRRR
jgi:hypothetical protein